jgi:hypothetical protein
MGFDATDLKDWPYSTSRRHEGVWGCEGVHWHVSLWHMPPPSLASVSNNMLLAIILPQKSCAPGPKWTDRASGGTARSGRF